MVKIDYHKEKNEFLVQIPFALNYLIQELPDRKWVKKRKFWAVPANWRAKEGMADLRNGDYEWTDEAIEIYDAIEKPTTGNVSGYPKAYKFKTTPMDHQFEGLNRFYGLDHGAIFFEQGLGKTKLAIDLACMWHLRKKERIDTLIVVCPVSIRSVWEDELEIHSPVSFDIQLLGSKIPKWKSELKRGVLRVLLVGVESLSQGGAWERLVDLDSESMAEAFAINLGNCVLVVDESTRVKNSQSTRTERVVELATLCMKKLIMTGTPVTQGIEDLYAQFLVLNPDTLALNSFYGFRNRYCIMGGYKNKKALAYKNVPELMDLIAPWSLRREKEDCLDLPKKIYQTRTVELSKTQKKAYMELKRESYTEIKNEQGGIDQIEVQMVLEKYLRFQQITGGFYPVIEDEESTAKPIPGSNPKMTELVQFLDELKGKKVMIWFRFRPEIELAYKLLHNEFKVVQFHGGLNEAEKKKSKEAFMSGDAEIFLATNAAAYGLTFTKCHHQVFYSQSFSLEEYLQQQDRIHRHGQDEECIYTHLRCLGTVDIIISDAHLLKKSVADHVSQKLHDGEEIF